MVIARRDEDSVVERYEDEDDDDDSEVGVEDEDGEVRDGSVGAGGPTLSGPGIGAVRLVDRDGMDGNSNGNGNGTSHQ